MLATSRFTLLMLLAALLTSSPMPCTAQQPAAPASSPTVPQRTEIAEGDRIEPSALATAIQQSASPLVLQIGPRSFFDQAHVLGAEYVGAASTEAGVQSLRTRVANVAKDRWIVLYCGCCPWDRCPNIRPAFRELKSLGFTHVQALYLPDNFGSDWVDKGYPTEH